MAAITALASLPKSKMVARSRVHETAAVGKPGQEAGGPYLNAVALVKTKLPPRTLLEHLHRIERGEGRDRASETARWLPRTLDLDLLLYDDVVIDEPGLTIPHPRMHMRRFVLVPLAEVAPAWEVPGIGRTVADLLAHAPE